MAQRNKNAQSASPHYRAYLVRLWRDDTQGPWRASAQSVQSGGMVRFATLQELFAFLEMHAPATSQAGHTDECTIFD